MEGIMANGIDVSTKLKALRGKRQGLLELQNHLQARNPLPQDDINDVADKINDLDTEIESLKTLPEIPFDPNSQQKLKKLLRKLRQGIAQSHAVSTLMETATSIINEGAA
jgi:hypothetical protein